MSTAKQLIPLRAILFGFVLSACMAAGAKAEAPQWVRAALKEEDPGWGQNAPSLVLLNCGAVDYLPGGRIRETYRVVVRLQKQDGLAEVYPHLMYNADTDKVLSLQAGSISPDGKTTKTYGRSDFLDVVAEFNHLVWNARRVVTFSARGDVKVGGVLAWEIQKESATGMQDCRWFFRMRQPVLNSVFTVTPVAEGKLVAFSQGRKCPEPVSGEKPGSLCWTQNRLRASPEAEEGTFLPTPMMVAVRCVSAGSLAKRLETWGGFAALAEEIIEPRIVDDEAVAAKAALLVKGRTERWERVRAITEFAQKEIAYLSVTLDKDSLAGYRPHLPAEVIKTGFGDCKDKAALTCALLRHIGERAWVVLVNARNPRGALPEWPSASFNHAIVAIAAGEAAPADWPQIDGGALGRLILFDATAASIPFGVLPEWDQGGYCLVVSKQTDGLAPLPMESPAGNRLERRLTGMITETGDIDAAVEEPLGGSHGAVDHYLQINQGQEKYTHSLESRLHDTMPLIHDLKWKAEWSVEGARSRLNYSFVAERAVPLASRDMLLVCPCLLNRNLRHGPWKKDQEGLFWQPARGIHEEVSLRIPEGFEAGSTPGGWRQETASASASITYRLSGQTLTYVFELEQKAGLLDHSDYETLRAFYQKLEEADRRPVVVRRLQPPAS